MRDNERRAYYEDILSAALDVKVITLIKFFIAQSFHKQIGDNVT